MHVRRFCCGWLEMDRSGLVSGDEGHLRLPVPAYLIERAGTRLVFDAGLPPELRENEIAEIQFSLDDSTPRFRR